MRLWARNAGHSVRWGVSVTNGLVRAMTRKSYGALAASLSVAALLLAANPTFARSGAAHGGALASAHPISRPQAAQAFRHHRRNNAAIFWPGVAGYDYGPSNGEPLADVPPPASGDVHYTYTQDVPWDWAHRYPPAVTPSERAYVPSCPAENVTVLDRNGKEQTVSVMRCY